MRKLFAFALVALLLGVGIVAVIQTDPGYVLMAYGNYTLEASLWVALLLLLLFMLFVYLLVRLAFRIFGGRRSLFSWLETRKTRNSLRLSNQGMIAYTEGNWLTARRQLLRGVPNNEAPLVNYLLAARSSMQLNEPEKAQEYLLAAGAAEPRATVAVEIALAETKLQAGEYAQALATLNQATHNVARHPHVLNLQRQAYLGLQEWDKLAELLPQLQKHKLLSAEELQHLEREVQLGRLGRNDANAQELRACWQKLPKHLQRDASMIAEYVRNLIRLGDHDTADSMLQSALKQEWHTPLVRQYGYVQSSDAPRQLAQAEKWLAAHPEDPQLLMCLGRLATRAKLWSKARDYFESSYRLQRNAEICAELGRLLNGLGEPKVAAAYFREGLLLREDALPELPAPDKTASDSLLLARL